MLLTFLLNCDLVRREHIRKKNKQKQPLTLELALRYQDVKNNSFQSVPERLDPAEKHQMKQQKARALSSAEAQWSCAPHSSVSWAVGRAESGASPAQTQPLFSPRSCRVKSENLTIKAPLSEANRSSVDASSATLFIFTEKRNKHPSPFQGD